MSGTQDRDRELLERIKQQLDETESALSDATLRELRLTRHQVLAQRPDPRRVWQPIGLAALAAGVALIAIGLHSMHRSPANFAPGIEDMQLLSTSDDLELYENLEFYQWLEFEARSG